jgi:hypothetical protein
MGRALGFRAEAQQIHWAVVEGTQRDPILTAHDKAAAPVDLDEASALSWYSNRVRHVIDSYHPALAAVRSAEPVARGGSREGSRRRLRIEGVLLQTINSCGLKATTGALAAISAKLRTKKAKKYVESGEFRGLDLSQIPPFAREAILIAVAALPENEE